ncbi:hypothetical protein M2263_002644 [Providencia alcalifaciens]|nr:hypothetical protein [Providencia alcalifaciens]
MKIMNTQSFSANEKMVNFTAKDEYIKYHGRFEGEIVQVSEKTINNLFYARKIIKKTQDLLRFGAGNQRCDIINTKGESFLRANYAMTKHGDSIINHAEMCIQTQAGNCSGHADVAYSLIDKDKVNLPVGRATSDVVDHAFVVIGDPRDPTHETVVIDAWPSFATPFILKNADKTIINDNPTIKEWQSDDSQPLVCDSVKTIPLNTIEHFFKRLDVPPVGEKLCEYLLVNDQYQDYAYDRLTSIKNPKTNYLSETTSRKIDADKVQEIIYKSKFSGYMKALKLTNEKNE